jgi:hypothetical protein
MNLALAVARVLAEVVAVQAGEQRFELAGHVVELQDVLGTLARESRIAVSMGTTCCSIRISSG